MFWMLVKIASVGLSMAMTDDQESGTWVTDEGHVFNVVVNSDVEATDENGEPQTMMFVTATGEALAGDENAAFWAVGDEGEWSDEDVALAFTISDDESDGFSHCWVQALADGEGEAGAPQIVVARTLSTTDDGTEGEHDVFVVAGDPAQMGAVGAFSVTAPGVPEGGPWLGVTLGTVSPELDAHLNLDGKGVMVTNVVEDSPASKAGLQRYDIILSVEGKDIGSDMGLFVSTISESEVGDRIDMTVLRGGNETKLTATLAAAPNPKDVKWAYPLAPEMAIRQRFSGNVHELGKGPGGKWELKTLKDMAELKDLPPDVLKWIPGGGAGVNTQITIENDQRNLHIEIDRDGTALEISQEGEGPITVSRTEDGNTTEQTYETAEDLEKGDGEAFELYSQAGEGNAIELEFDNGQGGAGFFGHGPLMHLRGLDEETREEIQKSIEEARESFDEAVKSAGPLSMKLRGLGPHGKGFGYRFFHPDGEDGKTIMLGGPVNQSFKVMPDGSIEVRYQKNDTEVVEVYSSEADLEARNPEMFEKFDEVNAEVR